MVTGHHRPILIVIAGPNGSGKTTITSKIVHHEWMEDAVYVNPDQVAQERFGDWNSQTAVLQAAQYCNQLREDCLKSGKSLIFETVLSSEGKVDFIHRAHKVGFFIRLFFVATSHPSINASRIAHRVMEGGHDVPIAKVISRYYKSILNCKRCAEIADRTYVYDNSIDDADARLLFRMTEGKVFKQYTDDIPEWSSMILKSDNK